VSVKADAETLRGIPLFARCDPVHLELLIFSSERRPFGAGEALISQGQKGSAAFLVLSGQVDILARSKEREELVGTAGPGAFLGEIAMIGEIPFSVTARARVPVTTACINRNLLLRVAEEYPEFGQAVFKALAEKMDSSMSELLAAQLLFDRAKPFSSL
jgi:CRP-like cAMP-binding protein